MSSNAAQKPENAASVMREEVSVEPSSAISPLIGALNIPNGVHAVVILACDVEGNEEASAMEEALNATGIATLHISLLSLDEIRRQTPEQHLRFEMPLLAGRLDHIARFVSQHPQVGNFPMGYFASGHAAAAALMAATDNVSAVGAIVLQNGRVDLAASALTQVKAPVLLLTDVETAAANQAALEHFTGKAKLELTNRPPEAAKQAAEWFAEHLKA